MTKIRCDICHDCFTLDQFRFLFCGHGFCRSCLEKTRKQKVCAMCRSRKGGDEPHQIFVSFAEVETRPEDKARALAEGLNKIDVTSPATSLERASRKIKDIVQHVNEATARELIEATRNLEERVLPLYTELEFEQAEKTTLRKQVEDLRRKLDGTESLEKQVAQLQKMLQDERKKFDHTANLANEARSNAIREMDKNTRLNELARRQQRKLEVKDEEIQRAQNEVIEKEKKIGLLTRKLRALSKLDKKPKFRPQDPDESLQIEPLMVSEADAHTLTQRSLRRAQEQIENQECPPPKRKRVL